MCLMMETVTKKNVWSNINTTLLRIHVHKLLLCALARVWSVGVYAGYLNYFRM